MKCEIVRSIVKSAYMVVGKTAKTKKAIVALTEESKDIEIEMS